MPRNVDYILLAEFNITTGSTVKHQYPEPIGVDTQMLAEFMLPDGTHKRERDWTVFFLNRPGQRGTLGDSTRSCDKKGDKKEAEKKETTETPQEAPPFVYIISFISHAHTLFFFLYTVLRLVVQCTRLMLLWGLIGLLFQKFLCC